MEQLAGFAAIMFVVVLVSTVALLVAIKLIGRSGSASTNAQRGGLLSEAKHEIDNVFAPVEKTLTHGQKIGRVIDATDDLGSLLKTGGYMTDVQWQPLADQINTAVAQAKVAPATEAPKA